MMRRAYSGFGETATLQMENMPLARSASANGLLGATQPLIGERKAVLREDFWHPERL